MKDVVLKLAVILAIVAMGSGSYARAESAESDLPSNSTVVDQLNREVVRSACQQNRADSLPNPFVDVPANHWAYKAVLTMYYCGAERQAVSVPNSVVKQLQPNND